MHQTTHDSRLSKIIQMLARLTQTRAAHEHGADPKFTLREVVEWDAAGHDVTASVSGGKFDTEWLSVGIDHTVEERLYRLHLN
jgi:hypothetical protein